MTQKKWTLELFQTELGWMGLLFSPRGLARTSVARPSEREAYLHITAGIDETIKEKPSSSELRQRLESYAAGAADDFLDVAVDLGQKSTFEQRVIEGCRRIPYGERLTYGELAAQAGSPRAARAVGNVMRKNRLPLIVPCHRVVATAGLGGFSAPQGLRLKKRLLALESGALAAT